MNHQNGTKLKASHPALFTENGRGAVLFQGFEYPLANFTYTPNQFFDVCLRHSSRGVVRLVAYMIRQTLGYMDADGNPLRQKVAVSYAELEERAGIGHSMIREAIEEAVAAKFIRCVESGHRHAAGRAARSASYELRWDSGSEYLKDPEKFKGFFEGDGNRTNIPNGFFDVVIPREALAIIKAVGSVIRFSIGFQTKKGGRRQQVALSYRDIQRYAKISSPRHLSSALQGALQANYLRVVEEGVFDPKAGKKSKAAVYAVRWIEITTSSTITPKREAAISNGKHTEKGSRITPKREAEDRTEKGSGIQTTSTKEISKQQQTTDDAAAKSFLALKEAGFDDATAGRLSRDVPREQIVRQIEWLARRGARVNRLGMLRKAIEQGWGEPSGQVQTSELSDSDPAVVFAKSFYAAYNGYEGAPTAAPSSADLEAAERYIAILLDLWPDKSRVESWGRAFGSLCISYDQDSQGKRRGIVSFAAMLRSHGDEFAGRTVSAKKNLVRQVEDAQRRAYEEQHRPVYLAFIDGLMEEYEAEQPEKVAVFEARRMKTRKGFETWPAGTARQRLIDSFDAPSSRCQDFLEFFADEVPEFWAWDRERNARILS